MATGNAFRRIRSTPTLWDDFGAAVTEAGDSDRSDVTRRLWRLYISDPAIRAAVKQIPSPWLASQPASQDQPASQPGQDHAAS